MLAPLSAHIGCLKPKDGYVAMTYRIGDLTVQGEQPAHTNIIRAAFTPKTVDGGKARIQARRHTRPEGGCGLSMLRADPALPLLTEGRAGRCVEFGL